MKIIDHAQRIREDLDYVFEIRRNCMGDKRIRIEKFLIEIIDKISKECTSQKSAKAKEEKK